MVEFQDRLRDHETTDALWDETEAVISDMGDEHFEQWYDGEVCEACLQEIPLDAEWGPMSGMAEEVERLAEFVKQCFDEFGEDNEWVKPEIRGRYHDYFYERTVSPENCTVCTAEVVDEDTACGHWKEHRACPVRGELP